MTHPILTDPSSLYYYDERRKIPLDLDTAQCVVEHSKLKAHLDEERLSAICAEEYKLIYGLSLLPRSILTAEELVHLEGLKLIEPVFAAAGGHVIVTNDIFCSKQLPDAIIAYANHLSTSDCRRDESLPGLVVESGRALDVLAIANGLTEHFPALSFTPCFIRLMKNPRP